MTNAQLINQTSGDTEYYTPPEIIEAARRVMGSIELDPASSAKANEIVQAKNWYGLPGDGLHCIFQWFGKVWLNHPFGRGKNQAWIDRLVTEYERGNISEALCITYACTSEKWFRPLLRQPQCYLQPRTNYLLPDGSVKKGVTKGSVVTYFGSNLEAFYREFKELGEVKVSYQIKIFLTFSRS